MKFLIAASTDKGNIKETNEDSLAVRRLETPAGKMVFALLCDGMGGLSSGEVASASLVRAFTAWMNETLPTLTSPEPADGEIRSGWERVISETNEKIKSYGRRKGKRLGTTLTGMLLTSKRYYIVNVGDTRAYELTGEVRQLTKDQTVVAREIEMGRMTPEQARIDPQRNVLLQCVGASEVVRPEMFFGETRRDAVYMLCSDGFRHEITSDEIYERLRPSRMNTAEEMKTNMDYLIELNKQRRERDNISVITVRTL